MASVTSLERLWAAVLRLALRASASRIKAGFGLRCRAPKAFCVKSGLNLRDLGVHLVVKIFQFFRTDVELPRGVIVGGKTAVESGKPFFIEVVSVEILSERARRVIHDAGGVTQLLRGILKL